MDNLINASLEKVKQAAQSLFQPQQQMISPIPTPPQPNILQQGQNFASSLWNMKGPTGRSFGDAVKMTAVQAPQFAGDFYRNYAKNVPVIGQFGNMTGNTIQTIGQGLVDVGHGVNQMANREFLPGAMRTVLGGAKVVSPALPVYQFANTLTQLPDNGTQQTLGANLTRRFSAGIMRGMTGIDTLAPDVKRQNVNVGPFQFDPVEGAGSMYGFTKNPMWQEIFPLTAKLVPSGANATVKGILAGHTLKGGVEGLIQGLSQLPDHATAEDYLKVLGSNMALGAGSELTFEALGQSLGYIGKKVDLIKAGKNFVNGLQNEIRSNMRPIGQPGGKKIPYWLYKLKDQSGGIDFSADVTNPFTSTVPLHQQQIEQAINAGNLPQAQQIVNSMDNADPYKKAMQNVLDTITPSQYKKTGTVPTQMAIKEKVKAQPEGPGPLPWEHNTPESPAMPINTDKNALQQGEIMGGTNEQGKPSNEVRQKFADWVNNIKASYVEKIIKKKEFSDLNDKGLNGFFEFQSGNKTGRYADVKQYFDTKYKTLQQKGVDFNYKQDYLPQLWNNTPEEIQQKLGRALGTRPSFTLESLIKDYKTGIDNGLSPRFSNISDLVGWYEQKANKAMADHEFFSYLGHNGLISPAGSAPKDWVTLAPDNFPKIKVKLATGETYGGVYKAPRELAKMINNYLEEPKFELLQKIADFASTSKNRMLSFGAPGTALNAHGLNILARNTLAEKNPVAGFIRGAYYMLRPSAGQKFIDEHIGLAPEAIKNGMTFSTNDYNTLLDSPETLRGKIGSAWNKVFEKPLFDKMLPALKLHYYKQLTEGGMNGKDAAHVANDMFSGFNWEELGKSRDMQNLKRAFILAPDWLGSNIRLGKQIPASILHLNGPQGKAYRTVATNLLFAYVAANVWNKLSSGHFMFQNDPGHTFEIDTGGYTNDGQKRFIRPFGTAVDFLRIPVDVALGAAKGDFSVAQRALTNRLSTFAGPVGHLAFNVNYKGQPIYGKDKYGNEMPIQQQIGGVASELGTMAGFPSFASNMIDMATGKQGPEQAILQAMELPFRYSGGAYSKTQKDIVNAAGMQGKDLYDLNKLTAGQSALSKNQLALFKQQGTDYLKNLYAKRDVTAQDNKIMKNLEVSGGQQSQGSKFYYVDDKGNAKMIDTSFTPQLPKMTGNEDIDALLRSKFSSDVRQKQNDLMTLFDKGQISQGDLETGLAQLNNMKATIAKPKKAKKIAVPKVKMAKLSVKRARIRLRAAPKVKRSYGYKNS